MSNSSLNCSHNNRTKQKTTKYSSKHLQVCNRHFPVLAQTVTSFCSQFLTLKNVIFGMFVVTAGALSIL